MNDNFIFIDKFELVVHTLCYLQGLVFVNSYKLFSLNDNNFFWLLKIKLMVTKKKNHH